MSSFAECKTVILGSTPSPDRNISVVISRKECGATVPYMTQASMVRVGGAFSPEKNPAFFIISDTPDIIASWRGNSIVEIALIPGGGKVFRNQPNVGDIKIEYK